MTEYVIGVDSTQLTRARQELKETANQALETLRATKRLTGEDRLAQHFASIDRQISKTNAAMAQANRRFAESQKGARNFEVGIQQAGYQIGDFAVQVQSGTNPLVAFSQQFSQLVGFMGPWGAALGAVAAIVAGIGVYFMKASEDASQLTQAMEDLAESTQRAKNEMLALSMGYENASQGAVLREIINLEVEAAKLRQEATLEEGLRAQYLANQALELEKQAESLRKVLEEERKAAKERERVQEQIKQKANEIYDKLFSISTLDISKVFNNALGPLQQLAQGVTDLYNKAVALAYIEANQQGGSAYMANQYALYGAGQAASRKTLQEAGSLYTPFPVPDDKKSGGGGRTKVDNLQKLQEQLKLERELVGTSEAYQKVRRALGEDFAKTSPKIVEGLVAQIEETSRLIELEQQRQQLVSQVKSSLEDGFMSMVEGTKSVKDAFKQMAYEIIRELYRVLVVQRLVGGISGGIGMVFGRSTGSFGLPFGRASGGSIMPNQPYMVGENGPELVIPRHSGTVVNATQTAKAASGIGTTVVNNNISVTGSDAAMVRAEVAKMIPQITNATKAAVIDARLRGGQMKAAFS